jgi:hypothetical protein
MWWSRCVYPAVSIRQGVHRKVYVGSFISSRDRDRDYSGHLDWADSFRCQKWSEMIRLDRAVDSKSRMNNADPFRYVGAPSGATNFLV